MFLICIPLYFYFVNMNTYITELGWTYSAAKMSLAQVSDVIFLILLPLMLSRLGYKKTIAIGILAWMARYYLLAGSVGNASLGTAMVFTAILLHGVCYDFLFIAGQLYVDDEANERIRGAAQGFIAFILWGVGNFVGSTLAGNMQAEKKLAVVQNGLGYDWHSIWLYPALGATGVLVVFLLFFRDPPAKQAS
jgi:MFS family permease